MRGAFLLYRLPFPHPSGLMIPLRSLSLDLSPSVILLLATRFWKPYPPSCPSSCICLPFSALLQSLSLPIPPLFIPWPSGFCLCLPLKPPRYVSLLHNPEDLFCSILLELSGGMWHSWCCIFLGKVLLPWLCGCIFHWFFCFSDTVFAVSFSHSSFSCPLQTQRECGSVHSPQSPSLFLLPSHLNLSSGWSLTHPLHLPLASPGNLP